MIGGDTTTAQTAKGSDFWSSFGDVFAKSIETIAPVWVAREQAKQRIDQLKAETFNAQAKAEEARAKRTFLDFQSGGLRVDGPSLLLFGGLAVVAFLVIRRFGR